MYYFSMTMARQRGLIKISGTIGDVNYFISRGIGWCRNAGGGFTREAILYSPRMHRIRKNNSEFGNCSSTKKQFRLALWPFLHGIKGRGLHSNMMQLFMNIKALDAVSEHGKRQVLEGLHTAKGKRMLKQFDFSLKSAITDAAFSASTFNWNTQTLKVTNIHPSTFKAPKTATYVGVTLGIVDFDFNHLNYTLVVSPTHFLEVDAATTSFVLEPEQMMPPEHYGFAILGLRYYEVIDEEVYEFSEPLGVRVLDCLG
jgi:hypothetical protein